MSIIDEQTSAINAYCVRQESVTRRGVRQGLWFGRAVMTFTGALLGAVLCKVTANLDLIVSSGLVLLIVSVPLAALVYAAVDMARITTRLHRAGVRRAAHVIADSRRFRREALAIVDDPTYTS